MRLTTGVGPDALATHHKRMPRRHMWVHTPTSMPIRVRPDPERPHMASCCTPILLVTFSEASDDGGLILQLDESCRCGD